MGGAHRLPVATLPLCLCVCQALAQLRQEVAVEFPESEVKAEFMPLDLSSFLATQQFVTVFKAKNLPLHILINNAGIALVPQGGHTHTLCVLF